MSIYQKNQEKRKFTIGLYKDQEWDDVADNKKVACDVKKNKAIMTKEVLIPNDGGWGEKIVDFNFSNGNLPKIYYFAVMDCEH